VLGATLARWCGVAEESLPAVFPQLASFTSRDAGFKGDGGAAAGARRTRFGAIAMAAEISEVAVLDTSALAAPLFGEPEAERIGAALRGARPVAPSLIGFEAGNVCLSKSRPHPGERTRLLDALQLIDRMDLRMVEVDLHEVLAVAEDESLTFCDASYLWLAVALSAPLAPLDGKLQAAAAQILGPRRRPRRDKRRS
jgi:predicted nucleic acid-binding protein